MQQRNPTSTQRTTTVAIALATLLLVVVTGCGSTLYEAQAAFKAGDMRAAETLITGYAKRNRRSEHRVIAHIELGSIMFEAGRYSDSARAFQHAEDELLAIDRAPPPSLTEALETTLKNPAEATYLGTPAERVMSATMLGLAYCMLGDFDAARPSFRSAGFWQEDGIVRHRNRIDEAQRLAESDAQGSALLESVESASRRYEDSFFVGYESVSNSFSDVVQGAFLLGQLAGSSDATDAEFLFGRASAVHPANEYAAADAAIAASIGSSPPDRTYVLYAAGFSPFIIESLFALPVPGVGIVTAAFPLLVPDRTRSPGPLTVEADGVAFTTELVADMDRIVGADFNADLPVITRRHVAAILARNSIAVGTRVAGRRIEGIGGALLQLAGLAYNIWQNKADLRSWRSLPKRFMYASFPTPPSGVITIASPPLGAERIEVSPTGVNMVYIRALRPGVPPTVASFRVGRAGAEATASAVGIDPGPLDTRKGSDR